MLLLLIEKCLWSYCEKCLSVNDAWVRCWTGGGFVEDFWRICGAVKELFWWRNINNFNPNKNPFAWSINTSQFVGGFSQSWPGYRVVQPTIDNTLQLPEVNLGFNQTRETRETHRISSNPIGKIIQSRFKKKERKSITKHSWPRRWSLEFLPITRHVISFNIYNVVLPLCTFRKLLRWFLQNYYCFISTFIGWTER